jgi:hypothetical protein
VSTYALVCSLQYVDNLDLCLTYIAFSIFISSPVIWEHMVKWLGVKSLVDVGCGRGISTSWFVLHGLEYVVCVEGSHDAVTKSLLPGLQNVPESTSFEVVEHDFSRGPWWPDRTVDVVSI